MCENKNHQQEQAQQQSKKNTAIKLHVRSSGTAFTQWIGVATINASSYFETYAKDTTASKPIISSLLSCLSFLCVSHTRTHNKRLHAPPFSIKEIMRI